LVFANTSIPNFWRVSGGKLAAVDWLRIMLLVDLLGTDMAFFTLQRSLTFCYPPLNLASSLPMSPSSPMIITGYHRLW
jgi:hypothetical protein